MIASKKPQNLHDLKNAAKKPQNLYELKNFVALYTDLRHNEDQSENIEILTKLALSDKFCWNSIYEAAYTSLINYWPNFPYKNQPGLVYKHYQKKTPVNKRIENHNFLKVAENLTLSFYRGYNQTLKNEYLNAIRFALTNEDLDYANCVLVDYSNWLLKKRKKYYAKRI